ncbi:MAG TPA: branched-chain amino acid ABC transporter permease [Stellaceae bacterium]|jgi:branched-chain amino acid transport system permease protein|nr:branched-chain amino acid ABC transporter permease [Stellaceae bacterium]
MTAEAISRGVRRKRARSPFHRAIVIGLSFGVVAVYLAVVGILPMINARAIIVDVLTMAHAALLAIGLGAGAYLARGKRDEPTATIVLNGLIVGVITGGMLALLVVAMNSIDLRSIFISLSPQTSDMLTFELDLEYAVPLLIAAGAVLGAVGVLLARSPPSVRKPVLIGCMAVLFFGVFQELIQIMMQFNDTIGAVRDVLYTWEGLTPEGAGAIFVVATGASLLLTRQRARAPAEGSTTWWQTRNGQLAKAGIALLVLILLPILAGSYIGQVLMLVGLYILMGMGLNLEVGLAGLLDLGFVAFFAVGAYTTALLTADSPHALAAFTAIPHLSFWVAMPIAVMISVIVGVLFGIPVLGVRGDYLAVATMGLGEIVRVIVQSDAAAPLLAGAQGILQIPKPQIGTFELADPVALFFLTLVCAGIAAYFAWRLESSRLGRAWMAVRDDEDVAQALGINLVKVKLLAYGLGAAFAGLSGSIFAVMLTSVYPSSFQLLVSINVLALIIVGGMGSLPGVIVGSLALVGLPELLREFGEYRYLFYGVALIVMMRIRPEGLWPSATRRRELHDFAGDLDVVEPPPAVAGVAASVEHRPGE